jgi:hypothetical protein
MISHRPVFLVAVVFLTCCLVAPWVVAGTGAADEAEEHPSDTGSGEHAGHEGEGVDLPKNAIGFLVGGTYESEEEETFFTIGLEYTRELSHRWSISAVAEHLDDIDAWVFVAPINYRPGSKHVHPKSHFLFSFGPGLEHKGRRVTTHAGHTGVEQGEDLFLLRAGVRYPVHFGSKYMIVPAIDVDFVRENGEWVEAAVFDVTFAFAF